MVVQWTGGPLGCSFTRCCWVNRLSEVMMRTKYLMPSLRTNPCTLFICPVIRSLFFKRYADRKPGHSLLPIEFLSLLQLLTRDPTRRLGAGPEDAEEIKRHLFFKDMNWDDLLNKRIAPPFFPAVVSQIDSFSLLLASDVSTLFLLAWCRNPPQTRPTLILNLPMSSPH